MSNRVKVKTADQIKLSDIEVELDIVSGSIVGIKLTDFRGNDVRVRMESYQLVIDVAEKPKTKEVFFVTGMLYGSSLRSKNLSDRKGAEHVADDYRHLGATDIEISEVAEEIADPSYNSNQDATVARSF